MPRPVYPPRTPGYDRWSSSELEGYLKCGMAWEFARDSDHRRSVVRMMVGTGIHAGSAYDATQKRLGASPRPIDIIDASVDGYDAEVEASEVVESKSEVGKGRDDCAEASKEYAIRAAPLVDGGSLLLVESPLRILLDGDDEKIEFVGTPDRFETSAVGDLKSGRKWSRSDVDQSRQLTGYDLLFESEYGRYPDTVYVDNISKTSRGYEHERIVSRRNDRDRDAFWEILVRATRARRAGVALPAPQGAWWCSKSWCPFWNECPAVIGRRDNTKEI